MGTGGVQNYPLAQVRGITKSYGRFTAIRDVSFSIHSGEVLGLIGPNGAGKTTLFECLAGVQPFDAGAVSFGGSDGSQSRSSALFYVPDGIAPWPQQSVDWGLEFTLGFWRGRSDLRDEVVSELGLGSLLATRIGTLSKGQRKRFLLAVGLLAPQPLVVIDEPFEGLDLRQSRELEATLRRHVARGRTLFLSIHQIADAARICDRFVLLSNGRLVAEGGLEELTAMAIQRAGQLREVNFEEIFLALT
jgi:ABC-2 type transport system ATP-binding protein